MYLNTVVNTHAVVVHTIRGMLRISWIKKTNRYVYVYWFLVLSMSACNHVTILTFSLLFISVFPGSPVGPVGPYKVINTKCHQYDDHKYVYNVTFVISVRSFTQRTRGPAGPWGPTSPCKSKIIRHSVISLSTLLLKLPPPYFFSMFSLVTLYEE